MPLEFPCFSLLTIATQKGLRADRMMHFAKGTLLIVAQVTLILLNSNFASAICAKTLELKWMESTSQYHQTCSASVGKAPEFQKVCWEQQSRCELKTSQTSTLSKKFGLNIARDNQTVCFGPVIYMNKGSIKYWDVDVIGKYEVTCRSPQQKGTSVTNVTVRVDRVNRNSPFFRTSTLSFTVTEQPFAFQLIGNASAVDNDNGLSGLVSYSLEDFITARPVKNFMIGVNSGLLYGMKLGDNRSDWKLRVKARDHADPPRTKFATVSVRINQWPPKCKNNDVTLMTSKDGLTSVLINQTIKIDCSDPNNGQLTFKLASVNGGLQGLETASYFEVADSSKGEVTIKKALPLNRYLYKISLQVSDNQQFVLENVTLTIKGLKPKCQDLVVRMYLCSGSCIVLSPCTSIYDGFISYTPNTGEIDKLPLTGWTFTNSLGHIEICIKKDSFNSARLAPSTTPSTQSDSGQIRVNVSIQNWTEPSKSATVIQFRFIRVCPVKPVFLKTPYISEISDTVSVKTTVLQTSAKNAVRYILAMELVCPFFTIDSKTGAVSVYRRIEGLPMNKNLCTGLVWGVARGDVSTRADVRINIIDTNSAPECVSSTTVEFTYNYLISLSGNEVLVTEIRCHDTDFTTQNASITYMGDGLDPYFRLAANKLYMKKSFSSMPRDKSVYNMSVIATNSQSTSQKSASATANVTIRINGLIPPKCLHTTKKLSVGRKNCTRPFSPCQPGDNSKVGVDYSVNTGSIDRWNFSAMKIYFEQGQLQICMVRFPTRNITTKIGFRGTIGNGSAPFNVTLVYTYVPPLTFSRSRFIATVYISTARKGDIVTKISVKQPTGIDIRYTICTNCVSESPKTFSVYFDLNQTTGVIAVKKNFTDIQTQILSQTIKATDKFGRQASVSLRIVILYSNYMPSCKLSLISPVVNLLDHWGRVLFGSIICNIMQNGKNEVYLVELRSKDKVQSFIFSGLNSGDSNSTYLGVGETISFYLRTDGYPQMRASYEMQVVVTSPAGAGNPVLSKTYRANYNTSVAIPIHRPNVHTQFVTAHSFRLRWIWGEQGPPPERFLGQAKHIVIRWKEASDKGNKTDRRMEVPNTASGADVKSLRSNTSYYVTLILVNKDSYYKPVEYNLQPVKTADPYFYEVLIRDKKPVFKMDLLNKTSKYFQDTLKKFMVGEYSWSVFELQLQRLESRGFVNYTFKYFASGSVIAAVNVVMNRNVQGSKTALYNVLSKIGGVNKNITEQGKGSIKVLSLTINGHSPQRGSRRTQRVQFESETNEANCTARAYGPETPIFKWYIGNGRVLNISTARVYFSKYWQDMKGQYISTLFFKEMIPRDSGNLTCQVELSPLSSNSKLIFDTRSIPIAVLPKPVMVITPSKVSAKKGEKVTLECRSTYPDVRNIEKGVFKQIIWKRNNIPLDSKASSREKIGHEGVNSTRTNSTIVIANMQANATYTCVGRNAAGVGEATAVVSVYSDGTSLCPAETHEGILWSATVVGESDSQRCMGGYIGMASRKCSTNANGYGWERPSLVHCVSYEMQNIYLESVDLAHGINTRTVEASSARLRKVTGGKTKLVSGELFKSVSIIENFVTAEEIRGSGTDLTEQNIVQSASNILDLKYNSSWLDVQELYAGTALLMKQLDRYGRVVSGRHVQNKWRVVPSKNIVLQTKKAKATEMNLDAKIQRVVFPDSGLADMPIWANKELTQLSVDVKAIYGDAEVGLCGLLYKTLNVLLPGDNSENTTSISTVNSDILALSITSERNNGRFDPPIRLKFKHVEKDFTNATCNFWDFNANKTAEMRKNVGAWSTAGCELVESDDNYTTCECDHLTNFAILMSPSKTIKTPVALKYLTWIGCGISLACLVMTVIIYAIYWKKLNSERSVILLNLCVSLILALVTFLAGVERKENKHVCTAIAAMLHFFFLAVFSFMLMEGIELYILLVKVFAFGGGRKKWYILGGWGLPAVVVGISLGATQAKGYGNEHYCWLSLDNGLLWAFVVPALIIILINCVFLGMAMKAMLTTTSMENQSNQNKAKRGVRGLCILMPLLGTTWVFGVLAVNNETIVFQYIFTICNSLQGLFIFIFHSLMNQHLLKLWKEKRGRRASSSGSSNTKPMKPRIKHVKQNNYSKPPRKASLSTDDMTLGWESGGSEFKPDPNLGVMNNRAFDDSDVNDSITHQTKPVDHNSIDFSVS